MANFVFNPAVPAKSNDILLGEGIVKNNGTVIGATQGGSRLEIDRNIKVIKFDGSYGPVKSLRRYERRVAKLIINFLKINYTNIAYGLNVTVSDGSNTTGTYKEIGFDLDFESTDVLDNVTFEGYKHDGTACVILLENALNLGNLGWDLKEKSEVVLPFEYTGFYTSAAPTTVPDEIRDYVPT
jgi:hypothetical protein